MPGLYKKRSRYHAIFYSSDRRPKQKWIALGTRDKRVASAKLRELEYRHAIGDFDPWSDAVPRDDISLSEALQAYYKARSRDDLSRNTHHNTQSVLSRFSKSVPRGTSIRTISDTDVSRFISDLRKSGCQSSSLRTYCGRISHFFGWCQRQGMIRHNPVESVEKPRKARRTVRAFTDDEIEAVLSSIRESRGSEREWLEDIARVALGSGLRLSELCHMTCDWVAFSPPSITVKRTRDFRPKSRHERYVPIAGDPVDVMKRRFAERPETTNYVFSDSSGKPLNPTTVSRAFKRHMRRVGIAEDRTFHSLRHTYATKLAREGVDLFRLQKLLGHSDVRIVQRYAALSPNDLHAAVDRTFAGYQ